MSITLRDLKFQYRGKEKPTLVIPNLELSSSEKVFLFGPSGSGKTTLLEIIAGVLQPQQGVVRIGETDLTALNASERDHFRAEHLGYVFQSFNLVSYLSVRQNIELPALVSKNLQKVGAEELQKRLQHLCSRLGIDSLLDQKVSQLSIGQQQRVAVARALLGKPQWILADEPTSALDYDHREKFLKLLFEVAGDQGTGILFVSHDRSIQSLFDRSLSLPELNKVSL